MKKNCFVAVVLILCLLLSACGAYRHRNGNDAASAVAEMEVKDHRISGCRAEAYTMDITLDTDENAVYGTSVVNVKNTGNSPLNELCFRLYSANISEGSISSACNEETGTVYTVETKKDPSVIYVSLKEDTLQAGEALTVKLEFCSVIYEVDNRFGFCQNEEGKLYSMTFCFPQLAFFENGEWFEAAYIDMGESYCYDMTNYHVTLTAPSDYVVLSSGKSETTDGKTVIEAPNVREMAITACNFAEVKTQESNGVTINILTPRYSATHAQYYADLYDTLLTVAVESLELYSGKLGAYIYDELDVIPMALENFGGMEMPGLVQICIPSAFDVAESSNRYCSEAAVATCHEIGHQWFYCAVSNNADQEPWLDESFTSYLERLYWYSFETGKTAVNAFNEKYSPDTEYATYMDFAEGNDYDCEHYINLPFSDYPNKVYGTIVYAEGAWFLRELELTMGSERFFEMLRDWYQQNINQVVTGRAFIMHLLRYDDSQPVRDVINEYIWQEAL